MLVRRLIALVMLVGLDAAALPGWAAGTAFSPPGQAIVDAVDEGDRVALSGNTRPEAGTANDRGAVAPGIMLDHIFVLLKPPVERDAAAERLADDLHDPRSPGFHRWFGAADYGRRFGAAPVDIDIVAAWLSRHGFVINGVYPGRTLIDVTGTAAAVQDAFRTEIHALSVDGVPHIANMGDPQIPRALAPVIAGIVSLHDFAPHRQVVVRPQFSVGGAECGSLLGNCRYIAPADLATIYNFKPLFAAGISGQGQRIAVIEDSDIIHTLLPPNDWQNFRANFGLTKYPGSYTEVHPAPPKGADNCADPGAAKNGDFVEASVDAEWASAAAPGAAIINAACKSTSATFGGLIALSNLINGADPPRIISISYGECEARNGAAANATWKALYRQAVAEGISIFVAAGDAGAALCDQTSSGNASVATHGIGVNAFASTQYDVAVGGTDFGDVVLGAENLYWKTTNSPAGGSARSYVPEIPWNDSCASTLLDLEYYRQGIAEPITYGPNGWCQDATAGNYIGQGWGTSAGGGGPSGCATGVPSVAGVVGGNCRGYAKPAWQSVPGNPSDGVRDLPDVAMFAGTSAWGRIYLVCSNSFGFQSSDCNKAYPASFLLAGGTSFGAPIMAGVQALVNQKTGSAWGNPNPVLYQLARTSYGATGNAGCNASLGNKVGTTCVFHDVTLGDNDVHCTGPYDCFGTPPSGEFGGGVLSTSDTGYDPAYKAARGWDFATGLGSVNAANLVNAWPKPGPTVVTPGASEASLDSAR